MTCKDRQNLILLYAVNALDAGEVAALEAHLSGGCPTCAGYLAEANSTVAYLPLALKPVKPSAQVRERIRCRIAEARGPLAVDLPPAVAPEPARRFRIGPWLATAAAAALAAGLTFIMVAPDPQIEQDMLALQQQVATQERTISQLEQENQQTRRTVQMLRSPALNMVDLQGTDVQPDAAARLFLDRDRSTFILAGAGLKSLEAGKTYVLWFFTPDERKVNVGSFDVDESGRAELSAEIPESVTAIAVAAITDEDDPEIAEPAGSIQLAGQVSVR